MCKIGTFQQNFFTIFLEVLNDYLLSKKFQKVEILMLWWNIFQYFTRMLRQYFNCNKILKIFLTCFCNIQCYVGMLYTNCNFPSALSNQLKILTTQFFYVFDVFVRYREKKPWTGILTSLHSIIRLNLKDLINSQMQKKIIFKFVPPLVEPGQNAFGKLKPFFFL